MESFWSKKMQFVAPLARYIVTSDILWNFTSEDYYEYALEHLKIAEEYMSQALSGKNRRGILTDISNTAYRIKSEYLND